MKEYYVPLDGHVIDLHDGRTAGPGERVKMSDEDALLPHNAELLASGGLIAVSEKGEEVVERAERAQTRRDTTGGDK